MTDVLQDIADRLRSSDYKNEEHIRIGVVLRLLTKLGWNIWNPKEVFTEFPAIPREDATRVDIALFMPPHLLRPAVFIEIKAQGKLLPILDSAEIQLRDYNRNNQADISILTDGRYWRMYLSSASGEFAHKCFEKIDLLEGDAQLGDAELTLDAFLSRQAIQSGGAVEDAKKYLKRTDIDRIMFDVLPIAQRDAEDDPSASLVDCFLVRCKERGADCNREQAIAFIKVVKAGVLTHSVAVMTKAPVASSKQVAATGQLARNLDNGNTRSASPLRLSNKRGASAQGIASQLGRFTVFADSVAAITSKGFSGGYKNLRLQLESDRILIPDTRDGLTVFRLARDYEFGSSSAAASVFCGRSANGGEWKE